MISQEPGQVGGLPTAIGLRPKTGDALRVVHSAVRRIARGRRSAPLRGGVPASTTRAPERAALIRSRHLALQRAEVGRFGGLLRTLRRRAGPPAGPDRAVGPAGRLRCDARVGVAPPNSLRSPSVRCARTTAASMLTKRAARADPDAALLAALKRPRGRACAASAGVLIGAKAPRSLRACRAFVLAELPWLAAASMAAVVSWNCPQPRWRDAPARKHRARGRGASRPAWSAGTSRWARGNLVAEFRKASPYLPRRNERQRRTGEPAREQGLAFAQRD